MPHDPKQGGCLGTVFKGVWLACVAVTAVSTAYAQTSSPGDATRADRMDIFGYAVEGRVLLKSEDFTRIIMPFVGRQKTAADIERARDALQQAYHDLGHCSVKVELARPGTQDGVVAFRLAEIPASQIRDCLPMVVLDEQSKPRPKTPAAASQGAVTYAYVDVRDPSESPAQPQSAPATAVKPEPRKPAPVVVAETPAEPAKPAPAKPAAEPVKPVLTTPAEAAPIAPVFSPKFEIARYVLEGSTLLKPEEAGRVLAPFTGKDKDFGDVQRALEALQAAYQRQGYGSVEIRLPEQELERGEVRFRVIEAKVRKIAVEGNEHFSAANVRRSVPSLREGETPNSLEIARSIRLANENSAKQTAVLLRATEREDQVDAVIRVSDVDPVRSSVSLDNTGNKLTGRLRLGLAYQNANVLGLDNVMTLQYLGAPEKWVESDLDSVQVFGFGYRIPLYSLGDSVDLIAGYSNVDSGTVQNLFSVSGKGVILAARYNQGLPKWGDLEHKLSYGLDYRAYQNKVVPIGGVDTLVPDVTLNPISITYSGSLKGEQRQLGFYLNLTQNVPAMNDGKDSDFKKFGARFPNGTAGYRLFRMGVNYARAFAGEWQFRAKWDAQYTDDALIAGEQFAIGGADNVRGFGERYRTDDKGYRTNLEIYTPDMAKYVGLDGGRLRFLMFYDFGKVSRNREFGIETTGASLDSMGFGLRMNYKTNLTVRLDFAHVLHDGTGFNEPMGRRNSKKGHFSAAWVW